MPYCTKCGREMRKRSVQAPPSYDASSGKRIEKDQTVFLACPEYQYGEYGDHDTYCPHRMEPMVWGSGVQCAMCGVYGHDLW